MLLTTSRRTSQRTRIFCRELASVLPFCKYVIRGKKSVRELIELGLRNAHDRIIVIETKDGNPHKITSFDPSKGMEWSRQLCIGARTRKDMGLDLKVPPLEEDIPIGIEAACEGSQIEAIKEIFNAEPDSNSDVCIRLSERNGVRVIDFLRKDISDAVIGPQIRVRKNEDED